MITILIGSGAGAVIVALIGIMIHLIGRVRKLEDHRTVVNTLLVAHGRRLEAQARYLRISVKDRIVWSDEHNRRITQLEEDSVGLGRAINRHDGSIAKLDRAGHRHEEQRRT